MEEKKEQKKYELGIDAFPVSGYFLESKVGNFKNESGENVVYANLQILQISKKTKKPKVVKLKYLTGKEPELVSQIRPLDKISVLVDYATLGDEPVCIDIVKILKRSDLDELKNE